MTVNLLLTILIVLQVADLATTLYAFGRGAVEANPLLVVLQRLLGRDGAIVAAKATLIVALLVLYFPDWVLAVLCVVYVIVVARNIDLIRRRL